MASYQQILAGTSLTITETFYLDGAPSNTDAVEPTLTLTRPDGTAYTPIPDVLDTWVGPPARSTGQYRFVLPAQPTPYYLDYALVGTIGGQPQTIRGRVEWIGANLFNLSDLRGMRVAGSLPFATNAKMPAAALNVTQGAELLANYESSPGHHRVFCNHCGSPLFMTNADEPDMVNLRVGIIDGPLRTRPSSHYYVGQMANWWRIDDQLLRFETE